jgi:hypothetical protein
MVTILGETGDSGRNHGWNGLGKMAIVPNESRGKVKAATQIAEQGSFWAILWSSPARRNRGMGARPVIIEERAESRPGNPIDDP